MWKTAKDLLVTIAVASALAFAFRATAFATYYIPSESMVPTLEVGDRLAVSKYAYGWSRHSVPGLNLPHTFTTRVLASPPERGDVAIFVHPRNLTTMVKRVIGLPGDRIAFRNGRLFINGKPVRRTFVRSYRYREHEGFAVSVREYKEHLPGGRSYTIIERSDRHPGDVLDDVVIPAGYLFMAGDNRDNSSDSRFQHMGLVPMDNLIGRAEAILYSLKTCDKQPGLKCAGRRYLSLIQ